MRQPDDPTRGEAKLAASVVQPPEGWQHCCCPTCGRVFTVPSDGTPEDLPWCTHHDAITVWRSGGEESGWTPCVPAEVRR